MPVSFEGRSAALTAHDTARTSTVRDFREQPAISVRSDRWRRDPDGRSTPAIAGA
jgi:hypothetical protein